MFAITRYRWLFLFLLIPAGWLCAPSAAHADVFCQASIPGGIDFGTVDPQAGASTSANIQYSCTSDYYYQTRITLCFNIGAGPLGGSTTAGTTRQMSTSSGSLLGFELYKNASGGQIAGSKYDSTGNPLKDSFKVPANGSTPTYSLPIYAVIPGGQSTAGPGSYTTSFAGYVHLTGTLSSNASCNNTYEDGVSTFSAFSVSAYVPPACTITADDLQFPVISGFLTSATDQNSALHLQCVSGTQYKVGLDNGINASGSTRRMAGPSGHTIAYELYRDPARTARWGNSVGVDTVNNTASGNPETLTIYGRVPAQAATPSAGDYSDTVTVTITY